MMFTILFFTVDVLTLHKISYSYFIYSAAINLIQNSPAVKKVCGPRNAVVKKDVKSKVAAKKWL